MATGPNDLKNVQIPAAWDAQELYRLSLADGTSYMQIISDINDAAGLFNASLGAGYLGSLMSPTDMADMEYGQGAGNRVQKATEYTQPEAQRGATSGHMLPLELFDYKFGWTARWLRAARRALINNDLNVGFDALRDNFEKRVLTRLFKFEEETGRAYGLGATGVSVPFADGGNGTVSFTPRPVYDRATEFSSTHNHFMRLNGITQANLVSAVKNLWEHGYDQSYELLISQADTAAWENTTNVTGYKPRGDVLIQYGQDVTLAAVDDQYLGVVQTTYGTCRIRASARIPTGYYAVYKSFGALDPRNPLKVRYPADRGLGLMVIMSGSEWQVEKYPLAGAIVEQEFGVGVGERISAVLVKNDSSGDYTTPTIS